MKTKTLEIEAYYKKLKRHLMSLHKSPSKIDSLIGATLEHYGDRESAIHGLWHELRTATYVSGQIGQSKTVVFNSNQIRYFMLSDFPDGAVYQLPFESCFFQFDQPIEIDVPVLDRVDSDLVVGMWLYQHIALEEDYCAAKEAIDNQSKYSKMLEKAFDVSIDSPIPVQAGQVFNSLVLIYEDFSNFRYSWAGRVATQADGELTHMVDFQNYWKKIAILCSVYINCKNMELVEFPESRKAAKKARKKYGVNPPPYYRCMIKGRQPESESGNGQGFKHGHRYDVRGHFRTYKNGNTIWVTPHQRGIDNELYIPKTYVVN